MFSNGPTVVTNGLVLALDAGDRNSYVSGSTTWFDLTGVNNGTLTNGPTFNTGSGGSIVFDGVDDYMENTSLSTFNSQSLSISWWINGNTQSGKSYTNTGPGKFLNSSWASFDSNTDVFNNSNIKCYVYNGSTDYKIIVPNTLDGNWHNISWTYNNNSFSVYKDSILVSTISTTGNISYNSGNLRLANYQSSNPYFNGKFSNVLIYNRALSSDEVLQNYNATKGRFGL